jgi:hypothetical protein
VNREDAITSLCQRGYSGSVASSALILAEAASDGTCLLAKHMIQVAGGEYDIAPVPWEGDGNLPAINISPVDADLAWLRKVIEIVDAHLDAAAPEVFRLGTPASQIASMHRRVGKAAAEAHEAMEELSLLTGENPRKGEHPEARDRMLAELGDTAMAALLGIQSQVKDTGLTWVIFIEAAAKAYGRVPDAPWPVFPPESGMTDADARDNGITG